MLGVVKLVTPEPPVNTVPPLETKYQSIVSPVPAVAVNVTVPDPQRETLFADGVAGLLFINAVSALRDADTHPVVVFLA